MIMKVVIQGVVLVVYMIELAILLFVAHTEYKDKYYVPIKMLCSITFVGAGILFGVVSKHFMYSKMLVLPLLFCALGDLFMGLYQVKRKKGNLILGIIFFLIAHIGLIDLLFKLDPAFNAYNVVIPIVTVLVFFIVKKWRHIHLGRIMPLACVYSIFLSLMLSKATQYMFMHPSIAGGWIGIAGILFFISDFSIIFLYFYKFKTKENRLKIHTLNLVTYYMAIIAFDVSILYMVMV